MSNEIIDMSKSENGTWEEQEQVDLIPDEVYEIFTGFLFKSLASILETTADNIHDNILNQIRK